MNGAPRSANVVDALVARSGTKPEACASFIVELSGIPGAGKSTISNGLVRALVAAGHAADEPLVIVAPSLHPLRRSIRKLELAVVEVLRDPAAAVRLVVAVRRSGQPMRDLVHRSQNWLVVRALLRRARRRPGIHVFDQGLVQELCSIGYRGRWRECLDAATPGRADLAPDVIVRVAAPIAIAQRRLGGRRGAQSRVETLEAAEQERVLRHQDAELDDIERAWMSRFGDRRGSRRLEVDNGGADLDTVLGTLVDEVRSTEVR